MINTGTDILILNGDIVFDMDNLSTVSSEDNIKQQAYLRLLTDLGESVFFLNYGTTLYTLLTKPYTEENARMVEAEARAALLLIGTQSGGQGWIEQVFECQLQLITIEGKQVKMLYVKYLPRGETELQELQLSLGGENI